MNIVICDDTPRHLSDCKEAIARIGRKNNVPVNIRELRSCAELLFHADVVQESDLLFMDIGLDDGDGMIEAEHLRALGYEGDIVFYTIQKERMNEAFDVDALQFVVKNEVSMDKLERIFLRAVARCKKRNQSVIILSNANETRRVVVGEIIYFEVQKRIVKVVYEGGEFEFYSTLGKIETLLKGKGFVRCHKSYLIASSRVERIIKNKNGSAQLVLSDGATLPVGKSFNSTLKLELAAMKGRV